MTTVFLTSASTSPFSRPSDWSDPGHTVEIVGPGGQSGASTSGTSGKPASGGGGGAYGLLTFSSGALIASVSFQCLTNNSTASQTTNATCWGNTSSTNSWFSGPGQPGGTTTGGAGGSALTSNGTPGGGVTYTSSGAVAGGTGGACTAASFNAGGGGGGAGGPAAAGGTGGAGEAVNGGGGGGGGAANNGSTGNGNAGSAGGGGNGGTGVGPSHGGGVGASNVTAATNGVGGQGAGGGAGSVATSLGSGALGGPNGNVTNWVQTSDSSTAGTGGGGGGGGGQPINSSADGASGGNGGNYGGGGGAPAAVRAAGAPKVQGNGASGIIVIIYTPAVVITWGYDAEGVGKMPMRQFTNRAGAIMRGDDGIEGPKPFWQPDGFELVASQDKHPRPEAAAATMRGDEGIELFKTPSTFFQWQNLGWEEVPPWQPPHPRPERAGSLFGGDPGNELFQTPTPFFQWINLGSEQVPPWQPPHPTPERRAGALMRGDDGTQAILPFWRPDGFEQVSSQDRAWPATRLKGAILRGDDGIEAPFIQFTALEWPSPPTWNRMPWNRAAATAIGSDSSVFPFTAPPAIVWGYDFQAMLARQAVRRSTLDRGSDGIELPFITFIPTAWPSPDVNPRKRFELAGGLMRGIDGTDSPFVNWRNVGFDQVASQDRHPQPERAGVLWRGDDGSEAQEVVFFPYGWAVQDPQPPHPRPERAAAVMRGEEGIEAAEILFQPYGWEVQPPQPPHPTPERRAAGIMPVSNIEATFVQFFPYGWEVAPPMLRLLPTWRQAGFARGHDGIDATLPPPPVPWFEVTPSLTRKVFFKSPEFGDAGIVLPFVPPTPWFETTPALTRKAFFHSPEFGDSGIASPFILFQPYGWEIPQPQPPHPRPERAGSMMRGIDGIESPFTQFFPLGWEQIFAQPPHRWFKSPEFGHLGIDAPFVNWIRLGFDQVLSQDPHIRRERWGGIARGHDGIEFPLPPVLVPWWETTPPLTRKAFFHSPEPGDQGIAAPQISFFPYGWEVPPPVIPHRSFRSPEPGDPGIAAPFVNWIVRGFDQIASQDKHPVYRSPETGDQGIASPFIRFVPLDWPWIPTHPHPRPERFGALARGHDGIEFPLPPSLIAWFETTPPLTRHAVFRSPEFGDAGITLPFIAPIPWFETTPPLTRKAFFRSPEPGDAGIASPFIRFTPLDWPQPAHQPRWRAERAGAIARGHDGTDAPLPIFQAMEWPWIPTWRHPRPEIYGALARGDDGTEFPTAKPLTAWFETTPPPTRKAFFRSPEIGDAGGIASPLIVPAPWFETTPPLTRHAVYRAPEPGDPGIASPLIRFFPTGWEVQPPQPPHPWYEKRGLMLKGDEGISGVLPTRVITWWDDRMEMLRRPAALARSALRQRTGFSFFAPWIQLGYDQVYSQEPRRRWEKVASLFGGDPGNEAVQIRFQPYGWEIQPPQPPHPTPERRAAGILKGDEGTQAPFILFRPYGWEVQPFQPPRLRHELRGQMFRGDDGAQAPLARLTAFGWEPTLPTLLRRPLPRVPVFLLQSVESYARFRFSIVAAATAIITPYSATATIGFHELNAIINAWSTTVIIDKGSKKPQ